MFDIAAATSVGLVRQVNEDRASVNGQRLMEGQLLEQRIHGPTLVMVADGMGGHARGEIASEISLQELERRTDNLLDQHGIIPAIRGANRVVYDLAASNPAYRGMGSTLVGAQMDEEVCTWFNVGDSRAYLCRSKRLQQLSKDHVPPMAKGATRSHAISQSLGGAPYFREVTPSIGSLDLTLGDRILLCSDGLTDVVSDDEIASIICFDGPAACVASLLDLVLSKGAPDNVTVIVLARS
ncbi:serine/threonine protein phosphatase PrpC [Rhizobium leguminosarum]|jgi:serine/threonine protein phosphatase PrpC|uniref:PP2C family protein-serine/threonine phosphatase n=1 Tax=Rhizobium leguminosarum TaxID=384 RepID=UPI001614B4B4|nr:protein phosphatase 2C domain-containing protein [Rhizobium leguminosarum]MBB4587910.1 serine/threonine protein phosphatase PrpC [Rhizobium leguminosarum]